MHSLADSETIALTWPENGLERVEQCPVCGSGKRNILHSNLRDRVFFCAPGEWTLYRCQGCSSAYLDPRPTVKTVGLAYSSYSTHSAPSPFWCTENISWVRVLLRKLANGYRNARYGTNFKQALPIGAHLARLFPKIQRSIEAQGRHLPRCQDGSHELLDIGCGNGGFLLFAQQAGWRTLGIDPDHKAVETARSQGLEVLLGDVEQLDAEHDRFEVITLSHVIEHVHHPHALLGACLRLLKPGGHLWLETPNLASLGHRYFGSDWRGLEPPRHLVLFTPASLQLALKKAGFCNFQSLNSSPSCRSIFADSEAIRRGEPPTFGRNAPSLKIRWKAWLSNREEDKDAEVREYLTMRVWKPSDG